ncbi:sodium:proton antiporter [Levilactobacillus brevis]|uniref:cation:proton antiporter n=1 Tax=Levilactobacillus brevis TaxID=1580 RepID=UPI001C1EC5A6|nr:sodium:proton antiporter [Levilactobacillus brevis]MBU7539719.1 sodium:proton antiporter [Levilactobacillus brevis]MBU7559077.1 sodium:proton antiporter [Levilactobacillus brevis]MBU7565889.1 sodium:proton antiporter [Levilactobacillus brevis]MCE6010627.1 sodium:proton antiporter [Levilactobacillus brevis]MCE6012912.1 sodium:proton antiporter [Levilactobacillus brevis]
MKIVFLVLLLLVAVVVGNVLGRHYQRLPLPFFLIGLGLIFSFLPLYHGFQFSPDVFTFAIIAPLMYNEAENVSRYWVGRGIVNIFSLAIVLVIVTVLFVGIILHQLFAFLPLSLALALCAIVTPTDAAAVSAIVPASDEFTIPQIILQNESLFNDASGIVAFDLALATYLSGQFSLGTAVVDFGREFLGGLLVGAILGLVIAQVRLWLIRQRDDTPLILVTIEVAMPFLLYYLATIMGVSGILAVVAAGIIQGGEREKLRLTASRMQLVSANVWEMIDGMLSSLVFVLLGISLPLVWQSALQNTLVPWWQLVLAGGLIYVIKLGLRLIWSRYLVWMHKPSQHRWLDSWLMALSGANGTITLALAFSLPLTINLRGSLIFMAAVVILLSLLVPTVVLPQIVGSEEDKVDDLASWSKRLKLAAITQLEQQVTTSSEAQIVIDALRQQLQQQHGFKKQQQRALFRQADLAEQQEITTLRVQGKITADEQRDYLKFLTYSRFTVDQIWWRNLGLRLWFGLHMGHVSHDIQTAQETFMTSPLVMEQQYWADQFMAKGRSIRPLEKSGYHAAMQQLTAERTVDNRAAVDVVRRYYHERHRQMNLAPADSDIVYELFLQVFHVQYELVQAAFKKGQIPATLAQQLQQEIVFDETGYIQNQQAFLS